MKSSRLGIGIVGGTGYGAAELLRILVQHPGEVVTVVSSSSAGESISSVHPQLTGFYDFTFDSELSWDSFDGYERKILFVSLPHGKSGTFINSIEDASGKKGVNIIDLSGDLRLKDEAAHKRYYPDTPYEKRSRSTFVYGLTELFREEIASAKHISNPGCLATAAILALAPIVTSNLHSNVSVTAATGSSGAGKEPKGTTHHPLRHANVSVYKPLEHQHEAEILEALKIRGAKEVEMSFVPQSLPVSRGIFVTAHIELQKEKGLIELKDLYKRFYKSSPFIRVMEGATPDLQNVIGTNFCDIALAAKANHLVVTTVIDNLVKGMAGQAIQNMNLLLGLPEITALWTPSLRPC